MPCHKSLQKILLVILEHLYKWDHFRRLTTGGEETGGMGWIKSIEIARDEIEALFEVYPSLRKKIPKYMDKAGTFAIPKILKWARRRRKIDRRDNGMVVEFEEIEEVKYGMLMMVLCEQAGRKDVADFIRNSDYAKLAIIDYMNQYGRYDKLVHSC